jgi:Carboxypeptidase regulatory-like domain
MKKWREIVLATAVCLVVTCTISLADDMVALAGRVTDADGKPIEHATVIVYHAGVKRGYSTFCPSCYADCGKRAITDGNGTFTFKRLSPDLWFELLVAHDGYGPVFAKKVDPSSGTPVTATLVWRKIVSDPDRVFRGRIEDSDGLAVRQTHSVGLASGAFEGSPRAHLIEMGIDPVLIQRRETF